MGPKSQLLSVIVVGKLKTEASEHAGKSVQVKLFPELSVLLGVLQPLQLSFSVQKWRIWTEMILRLVAPRARKK